MRDGEQECSTGQRVITTLSVAPLVSAGEVSMQSGNGENFTGQQLQIPQRQGYYPGITWIGYSVRGPASPPVAPVAHRFRIEMRPSQMVAAPLQTQPVYILHDRADEGFFTFIADGERSVVNPYLNGSYQDYAFRVWSFLPDTELQIIDFRVQFRYVPRTTDYPGLPDPIC